MGCRVRPFGVGIDVVGNLDGPAVGNDVGLDVVGRNVGSVDGCDDGCDDGDDGDDEGCDDGDDGCDDGVDDGDDGCGDGDDDGDVDGFNVGFDGDGLIVRLSDGDDDWRGRVDGDVVGNGAIDGDSDDGGSDAGCDDDSTRDGDLVLRDDGDFVLRVGDLVGVWVSLRLCIRGSPFWYNGIKLSCWSIYASSQSTLLSTLVSITLLSIEWSDLNDGKATIVLINITNNNNVNNNIVSSISTQS